MQRHDRTNVLDCQLPLVIATCQAQGIGNRPKARQLTPPHAAAILTLAMEYPVTSAGTRSLAGRFAQELEVKNQARTSAGLAQIVAEVLP